MKKINVSNYVEKSNNLYNKIGRVNFFIKNKNEYAHSANDVIPYSIARTFTHMQKNSEKKKYLKNAIHFLILCTPPTYDDNSLIIKNSTIIFNSYGIEIFTKNASDAKSYGFLSIKNISENSKTKFYCNETPL